MDLLRVGRIFMGLACAGVCGCGSLDESDLLGSSTAITLLIQSPDPSAQGTAKAYEGPPLELNISKAESSLSISCCDITCTDGSKTATKNVCFASGASEVQATMDCPAGSSVTITAECLDTSKTSNNVSPGFKCQTTTSISGSDTITCNALFLNQATRSTGDVKYCRVKQDSGTQLKILCGFNGTLTDAQKATAQCNIEIDTSLSGTSPTTVDAGRSNGFVSGTKGRPYFILGPGLVSPACFEYNTSDTKILRGKGAWGTDGDGNTTIEWTMGVRQMENIASGRKARFAAACTKDGSTYFAIPSTGMAELNTSKAANNDVTDLISNGASCSTGRNGETCASGWCVGSGTCSSVAVKSLAADVTDLTGAGCGGTCPAGSTNGAATGVRFGSTTIDTCITPNGNVLYVTDYGNHVIRKMDLTLADTNSSYATTLVGTVGTSGNTNGSCNSALLKQPFGCGVGPNSDAIFFNEAGNYWIRKVDLSQSPCQVSTLAGSETSSGFVNGTGGAARFADPQYITVDANGTLYMSDAATNHAIRKITSEGVVTTLAGGCQGSNNGTGTGACFNAPYGVAVDATGTRLYVADNGNGAIRVINTVTQVVTTLVSGVTNPFPLVLDPTGTYLYVNTNSHRIERVTVSSGVVSVFAGKTTSGAANGNGTNATFNIPQGFAMSPLGDIFYIGDLQNRKIRKIQ